MITNIFGGLERPQRRVENNEVYQEKSPGGKSSSLKNNLTQSTFNYAINEGNCCCGLINARSVCNKAQIIINLILEKTLDLLVIITVETHQKYHRGILK